MHSNALCSRRCDTIFYMRSSAFTLSWLLIVLGITISFLALVPRPSNAQVNAAAAENVECAKKCAADRVQAQLAHNQSLNCVGLGGSKPESCIYSGPGGTVVGACLVGMVCKATSAGALGGGSMNPASGLQQLGQVLGQLLGALMQKSSQPPAATSPITATTGCTTGYYQTSNTALIGVDPCAQYVPSTASSAGTTSTCDALSQALGSCSSTTTTGPSSTTLSASPSSGTAPLAVSFTGAIASCNPATWTYEIAPGDSSGAQPLQLSVASPGCIFSGNYTYNSTGAYTPTLLEVQGTTPETIANTTVSVNAAGSTGTSSTNPSFSATPMSGSTPLSVTFAGNAQQDCSGTNPTEIVTVAFGDGNTASVPSCAAFSQTYTYQFAGAYVAQLEIGDGSGTVSAIGNITINISGTTGSTASTTSGNTSATAPTFILASSTLNLATTGGIPLQPGVTGNIQLTSNGGTILANGTDLANNTEVAGFYGSDTFGSQGPQGIVGQLCQSRPWAGSFVSALIPPTFFDNLCSLGGYQVGAPPPPTLQQTVVQTPNTETAAAPTTPAASAQPSVPAIPPQATIWAVPASVSLGARTSIFWNTQGVNNCTETSPDGSFNQTSLYGSASTVPLTGPTTFTISCLSPGGSPVTNYVTVNLSI